MPPSNEQSYLGAGELGERKMPTGKFWAKESITTEGSLFTLFFLFWFFPLPESLREVTLLEPPELESPELCAFDGKVKTESAEVPGYQRCPRAHLPRARRQVPRPRSPTRER